MAIVCCLPGCRQGSVEESDLIVAEVFGQKLFKSDIADLIPSAPLPQDSIARANAYVEQWIREKLILHEAERKLPKNVNIEKLVQNYRSSLVKFHYEKNVIEEKLDSTIAPSQIESFYEENKSQYLLKEPILKAQIAILDKESDGNSRMAILWAQDEWEQIRSLCSQKSCAYFSEGAIWVSLTDFRNVVPDDIMKLNSVRDKKKIHEQGESYEFYLKVSDFRDENELPPLEYIQDQLSKVILHKRKQKILLDLSEKLYQDELEKNNVKVHIKS